MHFNHCTEEFQKIYRRYRRQLNESKKTNFNVEKLLEERSKQLINKLDEEALLLEDAIKNIGAFEGKRNRIKLENFAKAKRAKKIEYEDIITILDSVKVKKIDSTFKIPEIQEKEIIIDSIINSPAIPPIKKISLPKIKSIKNLILTNIPPSSERSNENANKIDKIIQSNPIVMKNISKLFKQNINKKKDNSGEINNSSSHCFTHSNSHLKIQNTLSLNEGYSYDNYITEMNSEIKKEYNIRLKLIADRQETKHILKVIDKHTKLKDYVNRIETYENKIKNAKLKCVRVFDLHDKKTLQLKSKYKRIYDKKFSNF
jgi:hypothetical protein